MASKPISNAARFRIQIVAQLDAAERCAVNGGETAANFAFFIPFSTIDTELFWVAAYQGEQIAAAVPVVRLRKRKATDMLRRELRRWLGPIIGPLARKTTLLVDT